MGNDDQPRIMVEWTAAGELHMVIEGKITHEHIALAAFYLTNTALGLVNAKMAQAQNVGSAAAPIIPIHGNVADALRGN